VAEKQGLAARRIAARLVEGVLKERRPLEEEFGAGLDPRDRAFAMALAAATLRHKGQLEAAVGAFLSKPLPKSSGTTAYVLLTGAAQLLALNTPAHAAIDMAVTLAREDKDAKHFAGLINAVLRKVAEGGRAPFEKAKSQNTPAWLLQRWTGAYGADGARAIAAAHLEEPALDISVASDAELWRERLDGELLPCGSIRLRGAGRIEDLAGFAEGAWWVQDAAAAMPARLLGDVAGKRVLDLCAAPGGKTAQLAAAGAIVDAIDDSPQRIERLKANLARLKLEANTRLMDVFDVQALDPYDAILLDAPCSATGTIRRHPDLPWIKTEKQIGELVKIQSRMLAHAMKLVKPGGTLVYCVCSLEPEEGPAHFAGPFEGFARQPVRPDEVDGQTEFISGAGDLRILPSMKIGASEGVDGFYAARLLRARG
jgi:16S rRNA (cytosine967-C5)-methyltransferase